MKTQKSGCTQEAIHLNNMATGRNRFSMIEELSSHAFCKIAAPVWPRRGYPVLPELSDNPLPSYVYIYINCLAYYLRTFHKAFHNMQLIAHNIMFSSNADLCKRPLSRNTYRYIIYIYIHGLLEACFLFGDSHYLNKMRMISDSCKFY